MSIKSLFIETKEQRDRIWRIFKPFANTLLMAFLHKYLGTLKNLCLFRNRSHELPLWK